jgi:hypothetical protein
MYIYIRIIMQTMLLDKICIYVKYIYICTYIYTYIHIYICIYIHIYIYHADDAVRQGKYTYIYIHIYIYVFMCTKYHADDAARQGMYTYIYIYLYIYINTYIYLYIRNIMLTMLLDKVCIYVMYMHTYNLYVFILKIDFCI